MVAVVQKKLLVQSTCWAYTGIGFKEAAATAKNLRWPPYKYALWVHSAGIYNVTNEKMMACYTINGCNQWKGSRLWITAQLKYTLSVLFYFLLP